MPADRPDAREEAIRLVRAEISKGWDFPLSTTPESQAGAAVDALLAAGWTPPVDAPPLATNPVVVSEPASGAQQASIGSAPERIWAWCWTSKEQAEPEFVQPEYIRADLHAAELAERDAEVRTQAARIAELEAEVARLTGIIDGCDWYWPEADTSSDACESSPWDYMNNAAIYGDVECILRGGIVERRFYAMLPPPDDDSDDEFQVDEATEEAAQAALDAEVARRAALAAPDTGGADPQHFISIFGPDGADDH